MLSEPIYDKTLGMWMVPWKCPVCNTCRVDIKTGMCLAGGPFSGYVEVKEEQNALRV